MKKRILSLLCVFCLMLTMLPISAFAAGYDAPTLSIEASYDSASNKVTAKVILGACSDLGGLDFHMKYDLDKLTVESIVGNEEFGSEDYTTISDNTATTKDIGLTFVKSSGMTVTGTKLVFTATFSVKPGQTGDAQFAFDDYYTNFSHKNGEDTASTPAAGSVTTTTVTIPKAPISSVTIADLDAPVKGAAPDTSVTVTPSSLAADVKWFDGATLVAGNFAANTAYTVKIKLTASGGDNFAETVTAGDYTVTRNSDTELLLTKTFDATAIKDTPTINTVPTASAITYGQKLLNSTLSGGAASVTGNFTWKTPSTAPQVKDSNSTEYEVVFTPTDTASYETATCKVKLKVNPKSLASISIIPIDPQPYTGLEIKPDVTVKDGQPPYDALTESDYSVAYSKNKDVGTADIVISPKVGGNYSFAAGTFHFTIKPVDSSISITDDPSKTYDGNVVADPAVSKSGSTGAVTYTYYTDAACTTKTTTASGAASDGAAPKNAGEYWVKATLAADSNHGSATSAAKKFTISQRNISEVTVTAIADQEYTGSSIEPTLTVTYNGTPLTSGTDYTVEYTSNLNVGTATAKIKAKTGSNFTGEKVVTFKIIYVFDNDSSTNVVCEGYAKAFKYLCDLSSFSESDLFCSLVTGTMTVGTSVGPHMWNIVTVGGRNYLVDVTNCDDDTVGVPDKLFLCGATENEPSTKYTVTAGSQSIVYEYDANTLSDYASSDLKLEKMPYSPTSVSELTVSGTIRSYGSASESITVTLVPIGGSPLVKSVTGSSVNYSFTGVSAGNYTLKVEKKGHAPWTEAITVSNQNIYGKDVTVYLWGDVNRDGKVNSTDALWVRQSSAGGRTLDNYQRTLANVNADNKVNSTDALWIRQISAGSRVLNY